jgi:hypothetical protein
MKSSFISGFYKKAGLYTDITKKIIKPFTKNVQPKPIKYVSMGVRG